MLFRQSLLRVAVALRSDHKPNVVRRRREMVSNPWMSRGEGTGSIKVGKVETDLNATARSDTVPFDRKVIVWSNVPRGELNTMIRDRASLSTSDCMRYLVFLQQNPNILSQPKLRDGTVYMVRNMVKFRLEKCRPQMVSTFVDIISSLGVTDGSMAKDVLALVRSNIDTPETSAAWGKCALSLWMSSLWHDLPTMNVQTLCIPMLDGADNVDLARLSWCVYNDPLTKFDIALNAKLDALLQERVAAMSLNDLLDTLSVAVPESEVINKFGLVEVSRRFSSISDLKGAPRVPAILLKAWASQEVADKEFVNSVVQRAIKLGYEPCSVLESLASLKNQIVLPSKSQLSAFMLRNNTTMTIDQLASLALSASELGLEDVCTVSYLAERLHKALVVDQSTSTTNMWKVGVWYCTISAAPSIVLQALHNAFPELCTRIASGMWDPKGSFVRKDLQTSKIRPGERSIRSAISRALSGMGVVNVQKVHVVNTPFVAQIFLPDHQIALHFEQADHELFAKSLAHRGIKVKRVPVELWETKFLTESKDDFLAALLDLINSEI